MSRSKNNTPQESGGQQDRKPEVENLKPGSNNEVNIGNLLRNEREKKGLTHREISEMTCIRSHVLKAIENEDWTNLPSPVFVKGFIRSYAAALGLDEGELSRLYQNTVPIEAPPPKPLVEPVRTKKGLYVLFIFLLLGMAVAYYIWKEYPARKEIVTGPDRIPPADNEIVKQNTPRDLLDSTDAIPPKDKTENNFVPQIGQKKMDWEYQEGEVPGDLEKTDGEGLERRIKEENTTTPQADSSINEKQGQDVSTRLDYAVDPLIEDQPLSLTAHVRERTWIKIYVDDGAPKEYMFDPGNHHEWKAREGFELTIGNAGGVDLEFNGEKIENLGASGQVVHLVFPQYYLERSQN